MSLIIVDNPEKHYVTINGVIYDYSIFEGWGEGERSFPVGAYLRIDMRDDGVLVMTRLTVV